MSWIEERAKEPVRSVSDAAMLCFRGDGDAPAPSNANA
jgi:hypothetical protein